MFHTTMTEAVRYIADVSQLPARPDESETWLRPILPISSYDPALTGEDRNRHLPLAGGWRSFRYIDVVMRTTEGSGAPFVVWRTDYETYRAKSADIARADSALHCLTAPRPDFAGLKMSKPHLMGIVNVTPDSFSDGGVHYAASEAVSGGLRMMGEGASFVDVGGESTRPGSTPVEEQEEIARIVPVIEALARKQILICADTRRPDVMRSAVTAGALIINDVSGFGTESALSAAQEALALNPRRFGVIAMHMQGEPQTMQQNPHYDFAPIDVFIKLAECRDRLESAGVPRSHIVLDPGFGFGKTVTHNLDLIRWITLFHGLGVPILIGVSRKSSITSLMRANRVFQKPIVSRVDPIGKGRDNSHSDTSLTAEKSVSKLLSPYGHNASERLPGSLALSLQAVEQGAQFIRTHDVKETHQALTVGIG